MKASLRALLLRNCVRTILSARFHLIILMMLAFGSSMAQKTWDGSAGDGLWNTGANWTPAGVPLAGDDVIIPDGITATIDVNTAAVCANFTMNGGATANTVSISGTNSLAVGNAIIINTGTGAGDHKILAVGGGTVTCASISLAATTNNNRNTRLTISTGSVTVTGDITMGDSRSQVTFTGAGTVNVGGNFSGGTFTSFAGSTVNYNGGGAQTCGAYTFSNLTLSNAGAKTTTGATVNGILSMEGSATASAAITYGGAATLRYNTATARTVSLNEWPATFTGTGGVIIANTGVITLNAAKQLGNNTNVPLNINTGATLSTSASNFALTFHGNFINDGTFSAGNSAITITGTFTPQSIDGFTVNGPVSMTKTGGTATFTDNVTALGFVINGAGGTLDLGSGLTHNFGGSWTRTAGTLNGNSSLLRLGSSVSGTGGSFTAGTGTVEWYGGAQNLAGVVYNNLILSGSGVKNTSGVTVNGVLSIEGTASVAAVITYGVAATLRYNTSTSRTVSTNEWPATFTATGGVIIDNTGVISLNGAKQLGNNTNVPLNINVGASLSTSGSNFGLTFHGNFINDGTFSAGASTITAGGTTATHTIDGFTTTGVVASTKTAGTATLDGIVNGGALTINGAGAGTLNLGVGLTHTFTGNWTRTGGTLNGGSSLLRIAGSISGTGGTFTAGTGTVEWNGSAAQNIAGVTYNNLTFSGSGAKTASAALTVSATITLESGTTFNAGTFTHSIAGDWINNGATFNHDSGTINLSGSGQSISGSNTFNNLTLSGSNTKIFSAPTFADGALTINTGVVADLSTFLTHTANTLLFGNAGQPAGTWGGTGSSATNINSTFFANATGIITVAVQAPTTYYSRQTGVWNAPATWSTVTYGNATNNGTFPIAGDIVQIGGGDFTVTVNVTSACATLNFQTGAGNNDPTVALDPAITLNVSGAIDIPGGGTFGNPSTNTLSVGAGILNAPTIDFDGGSFFGGHAFTISTGTATIAGDITGGTVIFSPAEFTFTGSGLLRVGGAFTDEATLAPGTGTVEYFGTSDQVVANFFETSSYNNLLLTGTGVKSSTGNLDINGNITLGSGTSFTPGTFTHTLAGNWINNGATVDYTGSTISLDGTAQTIGGTTATTFNNLTLGNTGTKLFTFSTVMDGILAINTGVTADLNAITTHQARALSLNGSGQVSGTWGGATSAATNIDAHFTAGAGIVTVTNRVYYTRTGGNWNASGTWSTVTYGNATNLGAFPVTGDIVNIGGADLTVTVNIATANCGSLNFQPDADFTTTVNVNGNTLNVSGSIDIAAAGNGDNNTLAVGTGTLNAGSIAFSATGPLVFGGHTLTISTGTATVSGDVSYGGVGAFTPATITFTGAGLLTLRGGLLLTDANCDFTRGTGTVNYNSSTKVQSVADFIYYNLTLNNTFGLAGTTPQFTLEGDTEVRNLLTMTSGRVNMNGSDFTLGASGTASTLTRTASTTTNWMYGGTFERYWLNATAVTSNSGAHYGLFPLGHSTASSYRPVEINSTVNPNTGLVTVTHTDATTATDLSPFYDDAGTNIIRKNEAQFVITSTVGAGTYNISATMTDLLSTGVLTDIRLAASNGTSTVTNFGTHQAATGTVSNPTATRTGVGFADIDQDWRITTISLSTPLPIELNYFKAVVIGDHVKLDWETATESNNALFTVEKTTDFESFYSVGDIDGKGDSRTASKYSMMDLSPISGKSYYRLKQTDFDGKFTYSQPVMVNYEGANVPTLAVYPNPSKGSSVNLVISGLRGITEVPVRIFNPQGQVVFETVLTTENDGTFQTELQIADYLSKGIYIIKAGRTLSLTRKLSIE